MDGKLFQTVGAKMQKAQVAETVWWVEQNLMNAESERVGRCVGEGKMAAGVVGLFTS